MRFMLRLTFTLDDIQVELLNGSHADLFKFGVEEHLHERRGQMFTGRHTRCLSHFALQRQTEEQTETERCRKD